MKRLAAGVARLAGYTIAVCAIVLVAAAVVVSLWLPAVDEYKPEVERLLSEYFDKEVTMTTVNAEWRGWNLLLRASGVRVAVDDHPGSGLRFGEIVVSLDPLNLLGGSRTFDSLELVGPTIEAARLPDGRFRVGDTILGTPRGTLQRLLQGRKLEITDGTLVWHDALTQEGELRIEDIHLAIRARGDRRRFFFTASPPADLMHGVAGSGNYDPRSLGPDAWSGELDISVNHLNLARVPQVIQERLPWDSRGRVDTDLHVEWVQGELVAASADLTARDLVIPYARDKAPLSAERITSDVTWRRSGKQWHLIFSDPEIVLDGDPVSVSRFELERSGEHRTYAAQDVNVRDLLQVVNHLDIELPWRDLADRLQPRGTFSRAALTLTGPYLEATGWRFEGDFRNVGWRPQQGYPGIQGLGGRLTVDDRRGELTLKPSSLEVHAPGSLRQPVGFERVEGIVEWYRWGASRVVEVREGVVDNDDLSLADLNLYLRLPAADDRSPYIHARSRIRRAVIDQLRHYLPAGKMSGKQVEWLDRALAGGEVTRGRFYLNGSLDRLPFENGGGELRVGARIEDGLLNFHPDWPNVRQLDGVIELENSRLEARVEQGMLMHSPIEDARLWSDDFFRRDRTVHVQGDLRAQADDVIQFLRRGPLNKNPPPAYSTMPARGDGVLDLTIALPFTRLKEASRVQGHYTFEDVAVEVTGGVEATHLTGRVRFTESTVEGNGIEGDMLGGPVRVDVSTVEPGRPMTFAIDGAGEADVTRLAPVVGPVLVSRLAGRAQWSGRFTGGPGPDRLEVESDLGGVAIRLPEPVGKSRNAARGIDVQVEFEDERRRIALALDGGLRGELHYRRRDGRPVLEKGALSVGGAPSLPEEALAVAVNAPRLDVDRWISEINELKSLADSREPADSGRDVLFSHLRSLRIDVDQLQFLHRNFGPVELDADSADGKQWTARIDGAGVQGTASAVLDPEPARYRLDMTRLYWPQGEDEGREAGHETPTEPTEFAHLSINAEDFRFGRMRLGRLELRAGPEEHAWRIRKLSLQQPELTVGAEGLWTSDRFGAQRTRIEITSESSDLGDALAQLGLEDQVANGEAQMTAELSWAGEPGDFSLSELNGALSFNVRDGRVLKLDPGSGRLLGLFNMDVLARRFTLDFSDVFKEGLAFDRIDGQADIDAGRLSTDGIFIVGPAALMELSGTTDMGEETYDLEVTVAPQLGGNLSLAGAIANPAAGAMIFVLQKLFKKQMAKLIHYEYRVTGDWDDPRVEQVEKAVPEADRQVGRN